VRKIVIEEGLIEMDKLEEILFVENLMHPKFFR
jgi:aspartate ammonia-lyase